MIRPTINQIATGALEVSGLAEMSSLVTLATGFMQTGQGLRGSLICGFTLSYGFPYSWRTVSSGCGPGSRVTVTGLTFLLDVFFYMAIGYALIIAYEEGFRCWTRNSARMFLLTTYIAFALTLPLAWYIDWGLPAFAWIPILVFVIAEVALVARFVLGQGYYKSDLKRTHPNQ